MSSQIQTHTSNDRSRTYWTPAMERYFVDLMLDHMHRGNRVGYTFNKQAWTDMLAVFNAQFGSQYDKDVLKSRYTSLWKQFNDVRNILGQNGFSWDDTRQIVVADDYVWDAFIKVHPHARCYRTKALFNFSDLCLIYGYKAADGRYSRSSHDVDIEDDIAVAATAMGDRSDSTLPSSNERSRTDWTHDMDQFFIKTMLVEIGKGNKVENKFNKQAWIDMLALFHAKYGPHHGKRVLRHRYKKLWKCYCDISNLLEQNGFWWDDQQQMITAVDDVWNAYIKVHPHARAYRKKTLPNYRDLALIYGELSNSEIEKHLHQVKNLRSDSFKKVAEEDRLCQCASSNERSRTYWTLPMDRYLIDLLLDQVHRGNRIEQTFITRAWVDMTSSFNARFNCHHKKDVLKNRHKHFRKQYNIIKTLLEQNGFSWDETREMVTAEDSVWDNYTMENPDARLYRVKTVLSYHKLCVIFGQENYDGRYSHLAGDSVHSSDLSLLMSGGEQDWQCTPTETPGIDWTHEMDRYLINILLKQLHGENKISYPFNEATWTKMVVAFNEGFGIPCDRSILEDRCLCLLQHYNEITNLLNHNEFTWDESQKLIIASEGVWEDYIKEYPNAISYKGQILDSYGDLVLIFGNGNSCKGISDNSLETVIFHDALKMEMDGTCVTPIKEAEINKSTKRQSPELLGSVKVQKTGREGTNDPLDKMHGVVAAMGIKKEETSCISIESVIAELQAIPDIDDDLLLDACDLMEDERKAKTFLALNVELRKKWLVRKLRPT